MLTPADAALIRRDRGIPGLGVVLDPAALGDRLRGLLPTAGIDGEPVATYVRYKPGTACLVGFTIRAAGIERTGYAKALARGEAAKLAKSAARAGAGRGATAVAIADRLVAIALFPHDAELAGMAVLADREARRDLLARMLPDRPDLGVARLVALRHKPERRFVARLDGEGGPLAVLKVHRDRDAYRAARDRAAALRPGDGLRLAAPLAGSPEHRLLASRWLSGRGLAEALLAGDAGPADLDRAGAALAALHGQDAPALPGVAGVAARLPTAVAAIGAIAPGLADAAERLATRVAGRLGGGPESIRPIHGDFSADQVVLPGPHDPRQPVGLIDLDEAGHGDPAWDLGLFAANLRRDCLAGRLTADRAQELIEALCDGHRRSLPARVPAPPADRVDAQTAAALLGLAIEPFRRREPGWEAQCALILSAGNALIGGRRSVRPRRPAPRADSGLRLDRAWPRGAGHLLLEFRDRGGRSVAGQWFGQAGGGPDHERLAVAAEGTRRAARGRDDVTVIDSAGILLQAGGADRRLPALAALLADPAATLVAHRPERRAVVRIPAVPPGGEPVYVKVIRPGETPRLVAAAERARTLIHAGVTVPRALDADSEAGVIRWSGLPGRSLHDLLPDARLPTAAGRAGAALAALHDLPCDPALPEHDAGAEAEVLALWCDRLTDHAGTPDGPLGPGLGRLAGRARRALGPAQAALRAGASRSAPIHRDLHDKQILITADGRIGLIDLDTLAAGERALDLANLLVHLELRALQGLVTPTRARAAAGTLVAAYRPDPDVAARLGAYADAARLRLACVYAFRPRWQACSATLLARLGEPCPGRP